MSMWLKNEGEEPSANHKGLKVGDHVRISKAKRVFKKGYLPTWTEEVFTISQLLNTHPPQVKVRDCNGEDVEGSFYLQEVQLVDKPEVYRIEQVLRNQTVVSY